MATLTADRAVSTVSARRVPVGPVVEHATFTGSATASATDVFQMFKVGPGARIVQMWASTNEPLAVFQFGDGNDVDRYAQATALAKNIVENVMVHRAGHGYEYTASDTVDVRLNSASANTGAPIIEVTALIYYDDGDV